MKSKICQCRMWFLCLLLANAALSIKGAKNKEFGWRDCENSRVVVTKDNVLDCIELDLKQVPKDIFETPFHNIYLGENPYNCNCDMLWFIRKLRRKDFRQTILDQDFMICNKPARLKGKRVETLSEYDVCPEKAQAIDECKLQLDDCHKFADCVDRVDGYVCSCRKGYTGNGNQCTDIDECKSAECPTHSKCMNTLGTYTCVCNQGYVKRNIKCEDIDECRDRTARCHRHALCENSPGSYRCICKPGFYGVDGKVCHEQVLQTCNSNPSPCRAIMEICVDGHKPGQYECQCRPGFMRPTSFDDCEDIDECSAKMDPCDPKAECKNTEGSYQCVCPKGYSSHGQTCVDIDECALGEDDCHRDAICVNIMGSYSCVCKTGFQQLKDGRLCLKEEEEESFNMTPIIIGICVFVVIAFTSFALVYCVSKNRKEKRTIKKKALIPGKSKKNWLSNWMFPEVGQTNMNRVMLHESALTIWSESDDD